jgi:hypothetical protein
VGETASVAQEISKMAKKKSKKKGSKKKAAKKKSR